MENKKVPASYRIALGQIKRYFGDSKPTEKEVKKIAVEIAKRNKLDDIEFFMKWALVQIGTVNEANDSVRDYIDKRLETSFKKQGFNLPKNGPTVKIGYTLWPFTDGYEVVNDGVGIKVKKDGKELEYFDNPKLNYNKAVDFLVKKMLNESEDLDEATWDDAKNAVYDLADMFKRGKSKITSNNSINIEVRGIVGKVVFDPSFKL